MLETDKMICPECGVEMNKHAEKVDYAAALEGAPETDADLGGVVEEAHACPACGKTLLRRSGGGGEE
jgi:ribosomal protein S27AE